MEILRSDLEVALDNVNIACRQAADVYETAAHTLRDTALADHLSALARERAETAAELSRILLERSDGANRPPEEIELLKKAVTWAKAMLSEQGIAVLESCRTEEEHVARAASDALTIEMDAPLRRRLEALRDDARWRATEFTRRLGDG